MSTYGIVGGGIAGLTLAWKLAEEGRDVTVFEAAPAIGGLAAGWDIGDTAWDRFYHVTLESDTNTRALLDWLDIDISSVPAQTGVFGNGRLYPMTTNLDFLRLPLLGAFDKIRFGLTILRAAFARDSGHLEQIPVEHWLRRWSGDRTFETFWLPLLRSKLGNAYRDTSAAFIWATIRRLYTARSGSGNQERFGYIPGGYRRVMSELAHRLAAAGIEIHVATPVEQVTRAGNHIEVKLADGEVHRFDKVVVTSAAPVAARLCPDLPDAERRELASLPYLGVICVSLLFDRPLSPYYVTNLIDPAPFTGVIEMTNLIDPAELGGRHLVYLPKYVDPDDALFAANDDQIVAEFSEGLRRIHPDLADPVASGVARARHVMAIPTIAYSDRAPAFATSTPGLFLVNSAQIVDGTLNVNETVGLALRAMESIR